MSIASIEFLGAAGTVTGSRTLLRFREKTYLIDCGLFQGPKSLRDRNWAPFQPQASSVDAVILTHAHLDHSGYLPRLVREGFRGPVYASQGTTDLCQIMLLDAAHLQEEDAEYANRTKYSHHNPAAPLFNKDDAGKALKLFRPCPREEWIRLDGDLSLRLFRSGHIVGSSFVQLALNSQGKTQFLTFSGDIGHERSHTLKGPVSVNESDVLVLESTYGDRVHDRGDTLSELAGVARRTFDRGGVLVVPAFAVGRSQEIIFLLRQLEDQGKIPKVPVVLDSPMSTAATEVFLRHPEDNNLNSSFLGDGDNLFPAQFETATSVDESMMACMRDGPMVVISAAGMLNGGRILHHLKRRLPDERNTVLFVGYQAEGTKGRFLQDLGRIERKIRIHHQEVPVEAEIATLTGLSAHGDGEDMMQWLSKFKKFPRQIFLNHGTAPASQSLARRIQEKYPESQVVALDWEARFTIL